MSSAAIQADALFESCDECHGKNGVSQHAEVPTIAGISPFVLEMAMQSYLDDSRQARTFDGKDMKSIVEKLSEADMKRVVDHYSALPFVAAKQPADSALAASGEKIHALHCERCHTENGSVAEDDSSILAGQWKDYLLTEMQQYKSGARAGDKKMLKAFSELKDDDLKALAEFYASSAQ